MDMYISSDSTDTDSENENENEIENEKTTENENEKTTENENDKKHEKKTEDTNTYRDRPTNPNDLFVVLVINNRYVRWETFLPEENIVDIYELLRDKYKIDNCTLEIRDYILFPSRIRKVAHLCKNGGCTINVTTKNPDYILDKHLM